MIIDVPRFLEVERPFWDELHTLLLGLERGPRRRLSLEELRRLHYLYERAASGLVRLGTLAGEPDTKRYLESLVARAYAEIHAGRGSRVHWTFGRWFFLVFPRTFRKHLGAFRLSLAVTLTGCLFGMLAMLFDSGAKEALMPFAELMESPAERVAREESNATPSVGGRKGTFSAMLMTHNTRVAVLTLALGMTYGLGTLVVLFYNGAMLGAICADYVVAGYGAFLAGWLLPHGSVEIPAILIAGQAGLVLAGALVGRGSGRPLRTRLRDITPDLATLVGGAAVLLVWAGLVESFLSQDHEPRLPYALKSAVGVVELALLVAFLGWSGRAGSDPAKVAVAGPEKRPVSG